MGKWHRYLLMFLILLLISHVRKTNALSCVMVAENPLNTIIMRPNESTTKTQPPFDCWNSQLQLSTKVQITEHYNEFRNEIAKAQSILAYKMSWHWVLEKEAVSIALQNPSPKTAQMPERTVHGVGYNMICEESIVRFRIERDQLDLAKEFNTVLHYEEDILKNFNEYGDFRRSSVTHFACIFMVSYNIATLICVYCAFDNPIGKVPQECPSSMTYNTLPYEHLCIPKNPLYDLYGCDQPSVIAKICPESPPESWNKAEGTNVTILYPVTNNRESTYFVVAHDNLEDNNANKILTCEQFGDRCPPMLPKWAYEYNQSMMSAFNSASAKLRGETLGYGDNNVVVKIVQDDTLYFEQAPCCSYFFAFFLISLIIVCVLVYFTYKHSKINSIPQ